AIRPRMHELEYPYLRQLIGCGVPFSVISAGAQISNSDLNDDFRGFHEETIKLLLEMDRKAAVFTTRGILTQYFCDKIGMKSAEMTGDVAFSNYADPVFTFRKKIKKIAISDPHNPNFYIDSMANLYKGLVTSFPDAQVEFFIHGVNPVVKELCQRNNIPFRELYKEPDSGLDNYSDIDLHAGFRVHGHVSALSKGIYSYLLEQDGRGVEYGLTLNQRMSVSDTRELTRINISGVDSNVVDKSGKSAEKLIAMIRQDARQEFVKFLAVEDQVRYFIKRNRSIIKSAIE
ncbi:MAG: polysaccharide pyruvyl transferase family protein, partial [Candidatus Rifleibacteriota bacterium]